MPDAVRDLDTIAKRYERNATALEKWARAKGSNIEAEAIANCRADATTLRTAVNALKAA